ISPRHSADDTCDVVAAAVGVPNRILISGRDLPGNLIAAGRLLRTNRRPPAKLTRHNVRPAIFQRRARAAAVVKEKMVPNLCQVRRSVRLDHRRWMINQSVAVQVLVLSLHDALPILISPRHSADDTCDLVAAAVSVPNRILISGRDLPGNLIPAGRLLRTNRCPGAKLTCHNWSAAKAQLGT